MSNLSKTITKILEERGMKPADLARVSGIAESKLSRWLNGVQKFIDDDDLEKIANAIGGSKRQQAELVVARLRDLLSGPGSELVRVSILGETEQHLREASLPYRAKLPPKWEKVLNILAEHIPDDSDLRSVLEGLANMYEKGKL